MRYALLLLIAYAGGAATAAAQNGSLSQSRVPQDRSSWTTPQPAPKTADKTLKPCPRYGDGFYQLPGSDTCVKFSGEVRSDVSVGFGH